jgi:hypothetical protein
MLPFNTRQKPGLSSAQLGRGGPRVGSQPGARGLPARESEQLHSTLAFEQLRSFVRSMDQEQFLLWFGTIFGRDLPQSALLKLRSAVLTGSLPQPRVLLVSGGVQGHEAAYHRKESTILIDRELVRRAREDNAEAWKLLVCLLEEFGHHLDNLLRTLYSKVGGDAPLDEGARVAYTLIDFGWSRGQQQREFATHVTPEGRFALKVEFSGMTTAVWRFLNRTEQRVDAKAGDLEFFGAGRGSGKAGAYGHESIEDTLEEVGFSLEQRRLVYFGNWLRDFSQIVDPKLTRKKGDPYTKGLLRETLTAIVDLLARAEFGDTPEFRVTPKMLGVYRNEEHIDNPSGMTDARHIDPDFRGACAQEELAVNSTLRMKNFIRSGSLVGAREPRTCQVRNGESLESLARENGLTWQELAHYNFGTDVPEEVNRQLHAKVGSRKRTADGHNYVFTSQDTPGRILIPGVAGHPGPEKEYSAFSYLCRQLRQAVKVGRNQEGFRHFGQALHTLEDFFSHTNFVELTLIHLGAWVEPWVPAQGAKAGDARPLVLTSGKFGGLDTAASLLLKVTEKLKKDKARTPGELSTGARIALILLKDFGLEANQLAVLGVLMQYAELEKKYPGLADYASRATEQALHAVIAAIGKQLHAIAENIDDVQTAFLENPASNDPTHTQLAKDHDEHPLHTLAAELAAGAVQDVGGAIQKAWSRQATAEDVVDTAARYFLHPAWIDTRGNAGWILDRVRQWMPGHQKELKKLGSRTWITDWTRESSKHVQEMRQRADQLMKRGKR